MRFQQWFGPVLALACMVSKAIHEVSHTYKQKPVGFYGPTAPPVPNAPELRLLHAAAPPVQSEYHAEHCPAAAVPLPE